MEALPIIPRGFEGGFAASRDSATAGDDSFGLLLRDANRESATPEPRARASDTPRRPEDRDSPAARRGSDERPADTAGAAANDRTSERCEDCEAASKTDDAPQTGDVGTAPDAKADATTGAEPQREGKTRTAFDTALLEMLGLVPSPTAGNAAGVDGKNGQPRSVQALAANAWSLVQLKAALGSAGGTETGPLTIAQATPAGQIAAAESALVRAALGTAAGATGKTDETADPQGPTQANRGQAAPAKGPSPADRSGVPSHAAVNGAAKAPDKPQAAAGAHGLGISPETTARRVSDGGGAQSPALPDARPDSLIQFQSALRAATAPNAQARPVLVPSVAVHQVAYHIQRAIGAGEDRIRIRLHPAELGRLDVKLSVDRDGLVKAMVSVDRAETFDLLQRDVRGLERALHDAGLKTESGSISFQLRDGGQQGSAGRDPLAGRDDSSPGFNRQPGEDDGDATADASAHPEPFYGTPRRALDLRI